MYTIEANIRGICYGLNTQSAMDTYEPLSPIYR